MEAKIVEKENTGSFEKYLNKGLTGLANLGNTCFMNSALQCLSHTYELNNFLDQQLWKGRMKKINDSLILCEWDNLRQMIWSENCVIQPGGFIGAIQKVARTKKRVIFTGFAQNDLTEFLQFVTECFHNSISRGVEMKISGTAISETDKLAQSCYKMMKSMYEKEYSEFLSMFFGIHVSQIKSLETDYLSIKPEPFFNIHLPMEGKKTLIECFDSYTEKEQLEDNILNEKTGKKEKAEKSILFWSLADILIITLKRFSNNVKKNQTLIDFPLTDMNLSKYVIGYDKDKYIYDLYGICNHSGGVNGGHYTAFIKNANQKWYLFNDTRITEVRNLASLKSPRAYCFFYRKQKK
tara:strand:- start:15 stop:1067 length:1053 start_codon:yes stop_codon:yes gene_type:complete